VTVVDRALAALPDVGRSDGDAVLAQNLNSAAGCQGIFVATPASTHAQVVESVLDRDVPIFVEKPFTVSTESARRLDRLAGHRIFVLHTWRYHGGIVELRRMIDAGDLGRLTSVNSRRWNGPSPRKDVDAAWTLAPHDVSLAIALLGKVPTARHASVELLNSTAAGLVAVLEDEIPFVLDVSARSPLKIRELWVRGETRIARFDGTGAGTLSLFDASHNVEDGTGETIAFNGISALSAEIASCVGYLRGGAPPLTNCAEGVSVVECIETLRGMANLAPLHGSPPCPSSLY
jgi:predicted dehydrogenase